MTMMDRPPDKVTAEHLGAAAVIVEQRYRRAWDEFLALYRETGERSLPRAAEILGLDSYKDIVDGQEMQRSRRTAQVQAAITERGVHRCAVTHGLSRRRSADGGFELEHRTSIDLDRFDVRFVLRGDRSADPHAADRSAIAQLARFDLQRGDEPPPAGRYFTGSWAMPPGMAHGEHARRRRQWTVYTMAASGPRWRSELEQMLDDPAASGAQLICDGAIRRVVAGGEDAGGQLPGALNGTLTTLCRWMGERLERCTLELIGCAAGAELELEADDAPVRVELCVAQPDHGGWTFIDGERVHLRSGAALMTGPHHAVRVSAPLSGRRVSLRIRPRR